mgnify:CR=1 FL=1
MIPTARFLFSTFAGALLSAAVLAAPLVEMQTNLGKIVVEFDAVKAPKSVENFLQCVVLATEFRATLGKHQQIEIMIAENRGSPFTE